MGGAESQSDHYVTAADSKVALPPRYDWPWREPFDGAIQQRLANDITILDVGSGRNPAIEPGRRPPGTRYVGLDLSGAELADAGDGAYDDTVVGDATIPVPRLVETVDLAVSWQVFEHVRPLDAALENLRTYLRPGGWLVSMFSGGLAAFAVVNRMLPNAVGSRLVERSMRRKGTRYPVFPAYYDGCTARALRANMRPWSHVEIHPFFRGATYFHFSKPLSRAYLAYENGVRRAGIEDLATHYLLIAQR
jgi:SAM-dependent methyltransferase